MLPLLVVWAVVSALCLMSGQAQSPSEVRLQRLKREADELRAWELAHRAKPQREARLDCNATGECVTRGVLVSLIDGEGVTACRDCAARALSEGGLFLDGWHGHHGPRAYAVTAEAVLGVPNDASTPLLNTVGGSMVVLFRGGGVPLASKVSVAQDGGAAGVLIVDDGTCGEEFTCGGWLGNRVPGVGLAAKDAPGAWKGIRIPHALLTKGQGERLLKLLRPGRRRIDGHGEQMVN